MAKHLIFWALAMSLGAPRARALELSAGLFGGGTATHVSNGFGTAAISQWSGGGAFGLILEQRFDVPGVLLETLEDFQPLPVLVQTGSATNTAGYLPVDIGLRIGLATSALQPYFGVIFQGLFLTGHPGEGAPPLKAAPLKQAAFGVGGALGLDLAVLFIRLGFEFRATETVTDLSPSGNIPDPGNVLVLQAFLSARSAF